MKFDRIREGVDYYIATHPTVKQNWATVTFLREQYKGIIIKYGELKFGNPHMDEEQLECSFSYDIIDWAGHPQTLKNDKKFQEFMGDVIITILCENLGLVEDETVEEDEPRDSNPKITDKR